MHTFCCIIHTFLAHIQCRPKKSEGFHFFCICEKKKAFIYNMHTITFSMFCPKKPTARIAPSPSSTEASDTHISWNTYINMIRRWRVSQNFVAMYLTQVPPPISHFCIYLHPIYSSPEKLFTVCVSVLHGLRSMSFCYAPAWPPVRVPRATYAAAGQSLG